MTPLSDQLASEKGTRDMAWLKEALQSAVALEHATLPLYLSAMFSLRVQGYTVYNLIRSVVMEEMVHMAIASNILAALGGKPRIGTLNPQFPATGLPGGAEPDLHVILAKLSKKQLEHFMRLEAPAFLLDPKFKKETYPTIANLYAAIRDAISANADAVRAAMKQGGTSNQVGDDIGFTTITYTEGTDPLPQIYDALDEIVLQGEGSPSRTLHADRFEGEESHYAKYAEVYYGQRYQIPEPPVVLTRETEQQFFRGYPIQPPEVVNVLAVPSDGYAAALETDPNGATVEAALTKFDQAYTAIMSDLEAMWNGPADKSWPMFGQAVGAMGELRVLACFNIMKYQVPQSVVAQLPTLYPNDYADLAVYTDLDQPVVYGPRFRNLNVTPA
jgi:hypothetical protein